jgi:hypothetical protein
MFRRFFTAFLLDAVLVAMLQKIAARVPGRLGRSSLLKQLLLSQASVSLFKMLLDKGMKTAHLFKKGGRFR